MGRLPVQDVERIVRAFEQSDWRTLHLQIGDTELFLARDADAQPPARRGVAHNPVSVPAPAPAAAAKQPVAATIPPAEPADAPAGWSVVTAQSLGTFYRAPRPGAAPFVEIGQKVAPDSELCLIEVMKLFTTIRAGVSGTVRQVYRNDGDLVELGQRLFLIEPDA